MTRVKLNKSVNRTSHSIKIKSLKSYLEKRNFFDTEPLIQQNLLGEITTNNFT